MTPIHHHPARALLTGVALAAALSACGGGGHSTPPPRDLSLTSSAQSALTQPADGPAVGTATDASAPADVSTVAVNPTDTASSPVATANDATAPADPPPSKV